MVNTRESRDLPNNGAQFIGRAELTATLVKTVDQGTGGSVQFFGTIIIGSEMTFKGKFKQRYWLR